MNTCKNSALILFMCLTLSGCDNGASGGNTPAQSSAEKTGDFEASTPVCSNCGTVASITPVTMKGDGTGAGAVVGAVVGGLLGNQVGGGRGKDAATVVGAVGGAVAGNEIEKRSKSRTYYDVVVNMDAGGTRTVSVASAAQISVGTPVKVVGNNLELR